MLPPEFRAATRAARIRGGPFARGPRRGPRGGMPLQFRAAGGRAALDAGGEGAGEEAVEMIPGLPEEVAEKCLLHLPFLYHRLFRTVSSTWNRFLTDAPAKPLLFPASAPAPAGLASVSLSLPFLFAFAFDPVTRRLQCQALDPFSRRWLLLPPVPGGAAAGSFAVVGLPGRGEIYVIGGVEEGGDEEVRSVAVYSAARNGWEQAAAMRTPRGYMAAGEVRGRVVVAGEDGEAEVFDPEEGRWAPAAARCGAAVARYDASAAGGKLLRRRPAGWRAGCGRGGRAPAPSPAAGCTSSPSTASGG
ncbi:hypothetical protein ACP4OV_002266 [Aristida adscensionis]